MLGLQPERTIRVVAAVVARNGELLVCQRPPYKRHGGLWEFPGGKREHGESDADALRRELREELSVDADEIGQEALAIHDEGSPFLVVFVPVRVTGEPVAHEHVALRWGSPDALASLPLAPSDRKFVEFLLSSSSPSTQKIV